MTHTRWVVQLTRVGPISRLPDEGRSQGHPLPLLIPDQEGKSMLSPIMTVLPLPTTSTVCGTSLACMTTHLPYISRTHRVQGSTECASLTIVSITTATAISAHATTNLMARLSDSGGGGSREAEQ